MENEGACEASDVKVELRQMTALTVQVKRARAREGRLTHTH
jgi:hypothetical protein